MGNRAAVSSSTSQVCSNTASGSPARSAYARIQPTGRESRPAPERGCSYHPCQQAWCELYQNYSRSPAAVKRRTAATAHSGRPRRRRAGQQLHLHRLGHRLFDLRLEHTSGCTFTGNRFRFNCTDGTPGHSLYNENTFEYNGIAVLLKSVPSDPAPDFQNSVFPASTPISGCPPAGGPTVSPGRPPRHLSKSRLVFYGTLPNFL